MITSAILYGREQSTAVLTPPALPRGDAKRPINAADLTAFGRCPYRWQRAEEPEDPLIERGPCLTEWLALDVTQAAQHFIRRPDTYEALKLECPKCGSAGPANVCTRCGQRRRNVVKARPWNSSAKVCAAWIEKADNAQRHVIPGPEWDRAHLGAQAVLADAAIQAILPSCVHLRTLGGIWRDEATGVEIPVWARGTLVPASESATNPVLALLVEARNADPGVWEGYAYSAGLHIQAALLMALWNKLDVQDVREHLWIVVEKDAPRLVARRRASQELLAEGRKRLAELLACYATSLQTGVYPRFEPEGDTTINGWGLVALQPWMTNGTGPHGGYFAPSALFNQRPSDAANA